MQAVAGDLRAAARRAREALEAADADRIAGAARDLLHHGRQADAPTRLDLARLVSDLATAAGVLGGQGRLLRRLGIPQPALRPSAS